LSVPAADRTIVVRALTSPEQLFLVWLLGLPDGVDPADAASEEVMRLDRIGPLPPPATKLRDIFLAAAKFPGRNHQLN